MRTELQMMHLYLTGIMMIAIMHAGPLAPNGTSMTMSDDAVDVLVASNFSATSVLPALGSPEAQFQQLMMNVLWDYGYTVGCVTLHQALCWCFALVGQGRRVVSSGQHWRLEIANTVLVHDLLSGN